MGKKKLALKPVQRGFATTSVPTRKAKEAAAARLEEEASAAQKTEKVTPESTTEGAKPDEHDTARDTWDSDEAIETALYQGLIDRLQDKGQKEVFRILKLIDYEKRFALTFPRLELSEKIVNEVLTCAVEDESAGTVKGLPSTPSSQEEDKTLLRLYITYEVLRQLGFSEERVSQCIKEGLSDGDGWAEGLEWMWLHLDEEECRRAGECNHSEEESSSDALLVGVESSNNLEPAEASIPPPAQEPATLQKPTQPDTNPTPVESLFQSLGTSDSESGSDSDEEPDLGRVNHTWASLMLDLDVLKLQANVAQSKGKGGKKAKGGRAQMETPEMVKLKAKLAKLEKDYMFSKKDANAIFKTLKSNRDMNAVEQKLKGGVASHPESSVNSLSETQATSISNTQASSATATHPSSPIDSDGDDGGLFGNMLDEPEPSAEPAGSANTTIAVREMPIPKQFAFTNNTPKALLGLALSKSSNQAVTSYVKLSNNPRVARSGLEVQWSTSKRRVWRMVDLACTSFEEADNYVATLALNELAASGDLIGVNWRTMPPAYRELWDELETARKETLNIEQRARWKAVKQLFDVKTQASLDTTGAGSRPSTSAAQISKRSQPTTSKPPDQLQAAFQKRLTSAAYQKMRRERDLLPIAPFRQEIVDVLDRSQVLVFSGETGCGKSTQLPSFILEHELSQGRPCKIIVTEPRRISAMSLAQRVSAELGDGPGEMGTSKSLVGYSIRLESKMSASTRLAFVTNGIALRMLEGGANTGTDGNSLDEVTHIIIDEVHERTIESDFLLIILKELIAVRPDLKVILMSATVDAEKISAFFGDCPFMTVPGRTFPVNVNYLEDAVQIAGWHIDESSPYAVWARNVKAGAKQLEWTEETAPDEEDAAENDQPSDTTKPPSDPTKLPASRYSPRTVETVNLLDSRKIPYDLIVRLLERICLEDTGYARFSAATLVFMPGLAEIRKLNDMLQGHPAFGTADFVIYPLHSSITSEGQNAVFQLPPPDVRKIVISTNIAETGVTIPDITCVIDTGRQKEMRYDEKRQLSRLVDVYIAQSNAKQRRGRAGRVQEGLAFHLFTKARHDTVLAEHPIPEMLRLSLQDLVLQTKILKIPLGNTAEDVLLRALDPPSSNNIQRAVASLVEVKALTANEEITPMGRLLSKLPTDVHLGKFLLTATLFKCLDPALTLAAALSSKSPFLSPLGYESQASATKQGFAVGNSDFLTLVNAFDSWRRASDNQNFVRTFCKRNFLSHQNLQQIEEFRQQLLSYLIDANFVPSTPELKQEIAKARYSRGFRTRFVSVPSEVNVNAEKTHILEAALASGLYPKILTLDNGGLRTISNQQPVSIHPSSVNFRVAKNELDTNYLVYFNLMQSRKLYAWEVGPVGNRALALVCGDIADAKVFASSLQLDRKIRYLADPKTVLAIKLLRNQFHTAMSTRMRGRELTARQKEWFDLGLSCLATEELDTPALLVT